MGDQRVFGCVLEWDEKLLMKENDYDWFGKFEKFEIVCKILEKHQFCVKFRTLYKIAKIYFWYYYDNASKNEWSK